MRDYKGLSKAVYDMPVTKANFSIKEDVILKFILECAEKHFEMLKINYGNKSPEEVEGIIKYDPVCKGLDFLREERLQQLKIQALESAKSKLTKEEAELLGIK